MSSFVPINELEFLPLLWTIASAFFFTMILGESYPKDNKLKMEWNETMCKKKIINLIEFECELISNWKKLFDG